MLHRIGFPFDPVTKLGKPVAGGLAAFQWNHRVVGAVGLENRNVTVRIGDLLFQ